MYVAVIIQWHKLHDEIDTAGEIYEYLLVTRSHKAENNIDNEKTSKLANNNIKAVLCHP